ncbi:MAG: FtsX-like permease family protein [Acidimicrobiales bacterium]
MTGRLVTGRLAWLAVAVTVAVGFTVGAFGFSTQLERLLDPATNGVDALDTLPAGAVVITARSDAVTSPTALDDRLLARVRAVAGVAIAEGSYDQPIAFRLPAGAQAERPVILRGVVLSSTWSDERWTVVEGRSPRGPNEVVTDAAGLLVGQTALGAEARVDLPTGVRTMRVVGVARSATAPDPPPAGSGGGVVALASAHAILDPGVAPILLDAVGKVDRITALPTPGTDPGVLEDRLRDALPPDVVVSSSLSRAAVTQHTVARIDDGVTSGVTAFAALTVLISSLVVANTLSVVVAQRTREFGLLRVVGASRAQVVRKVLAESTAVGLVGAVAGFGLGIVLAYVAARLVRDSTVPVGFAVTPSMAVVAILVGLGVTLLGGLVPAVRAGRIPPLAALSDTRGGADRPPRPAVPLMLVVVGGAVAAAGAGDGGWSRLGVVALFIGVAGLSRWVVRPLMAVMGAATGAVTGPATRIGIGNTRRQPSRTAGAASTLMVGLALVGLVATVGASVRVTVRSQFDTAGRADLYLERRGVERVSPGALEAQLLRMLSFRRRGFDGADLIAVDGVLVGRDGATTTPMASNLAALDRMVDLGLSSGDLGTASGDLGTTARSVVLADGVASDLGVGVGDSVRLRAISGAETTLRVTATYANTAVAGGAVVDVTGVDRSALGTWELGMLRFDGRIPVRRVSEVAARFPKVRVHSPTEFGDLNASVADTVLRVIGVVLVGMIGIGYLGLVAALGLSTLERRKELVMLRAIGAGRAQVRAMVTVEAVMIGLIAVLVGLTIGVVAGCVGGALAPQDLVANVVVPVRGLLVIAACSVVLAAGVSLGVARRASHVPPAEAGR